MSALGQKQTLAHVRVMSARRRRTKPAQPVLLTIAKRVMQRRRNVVMFHNVVYPDDLSKKLFRSHCFRRSAMNFVNFLDNLIAGEPCYRAAVGVPCEKRSHAMSSYEAEFNKASKAAQKQISETEQRISETTRQFQSEWAKTLEEMNRTIMSRANAEMKLGANLSQKLSAARSPSDAVSAYQEWLTADVSERSEVARQFMADWQKFFTASARLFSQSQSSR